MVDQGPSAARSSDYLCGLAAGFTPAFSVAPALNAETLAALIFSSSPVFGVTEFQAVSAITARFSSHGLLDSFA